MSEWPLERGTHVRPLVYGSTVTGQHGRVIRPLVSPEAVFRTYGQDISDVVAGARPAAKVVLARVCDPAAYRVQVAGTGGYRIPRHRLSADLPQHSDFARSPDLLSVSVHVRTAFVTAESLRHDQAVFRDGTAVSVRALDHVETALEEDFPWFYVSDDMLDREPRTGPREWEEIDARDPLPLSLPEPSEHRPDVFAYVAVPVRDQGGAEIAKLAPLTRGRELHPNIHWVAQHPDSSYAPLVFRSEDLDLLRDGGHVLSDAAHAQLRRDLARVRHYWEEVDRERDAAELLAYYFGAWTFFPLSRLRSNLEQLHLATP